MVESGAIIEIISHNHTPSRSAKMDLSRFDGNNALQWIFQAEKFFDYYDIFYAYRLKVVAIHFDGVIVPWFQML